MTRLTLLRTLGALCALAILAPLLRTLPAAAGPAGLRLLRADATGAVVELRTPAFTVEEAGGAASFVVAGAAEEQARPGLPVYHATFAAPPGAAVSLAVEADETLSLRPGLRLPAPPAPPSPPLGPDGLAAPGPAPAPAGAAACAPAAPARISGDAWMRGQRVVTVALSPLDYCPATGELRWRPSIRAELRWPHAPAPAGRPAADPLLDQLPAGALLNPAQARAWRTAPAPAALDAAPAAAQPAQAAAERYKISVRAEGLYRLSYADLQAAGAPVATLDPRSFRLTTRGQPVAISVPGEADGRFDPADAILFYGQPLAGGPVRDSVILDGRLVVADTVVSRTYSADTDYGDRNVYWLEIGGSPGPRMQVQPAAPQPGAVSPASFRATVRAEEQRIWWSYHFTSRDVWLWSRLAASPVVTASFPIDLPSPDPAGAPAEVRAEMVAFTHSPAISPDHRARALLNGALVDDAAWDGPERHAAVGSVPAAALLDGTNQLSLGARSLSGATDFIFFDWLEVRYDRRFVADAGRLRFDYPAAGLWRFAIGGFADPDVRALDVTSPLSPRLLTGLAVAPDGAGYRVSFSASQPGPRSYLVAAEAGLLSPVSVERRPPSSLRDPANGADYIVIAPAPLLEAAGELAAYRAARGMRTAVVDVADLYDDFNDGIYHPVAIKRFLAYAYARWRAPAPQYAVLVGDGHWNTMGRSPSRYDAGPALMPPNLAWVDPWQGQVDSSNQLAAIVGDDILPDLAIGRIPARTPEELRAVLAKTVAHEAAPADAPWRERLLFVADNGPDSAGDFAGSMDETIARAVPPGSFALDRLYLDALCGPTQSPTPRCPQLTRALSQTLSLTGTLMLTYAGHGAMQSWAHEVVLANADVPGLANADRPPFVVSLDCLDGYWYYPRTDSESLIETLVRQPGGGAAAAFAPTGLGVATGHATLQRGLYDALFAGGPRRIGPATMAARLALYTTGGSLDLVDTFTIFGDPALQLALPRAILTRPTATPTPTRTPTASLTPSPTSTGTITAQPATSTPTTTAATPAGSATPIGSATPTGSPGPTATAAPPGGRRTYLPLVEVGGRP